MTMSLRSRVALAVGALLIPFSPMPGVAQTVPVGQEGALGKLLPPVHARKICFARTYDATHLQKHPKQKVTALLFQLRYHRHDPEKEYPDGQRNYYFGTAAKVKGQAKTLYASGECVPRGNKIHCGIDCDGGGVDIQGDSRSGDLIVSFEDRNSYLRMTVGCDGGEDKTVNLTPGADDRTFRLAKASLSACRRLDREM
jgi:hypothetical protein